MVLLSLNDRKLISYIFINRRFCPHLNMAFVTAQVGQARNGTVALSFARPMSTTASSLFVKRTFMISKSTLWTHPIPATTLIWRFPYSTLHVLPSRKVNINLTNYSNGPWLQIILLRCCQRFWSCAESSKCCSSGRWIWGSGLRMGRWWMGTDTQ